MLRHRLAAATALAAAASAAAPAAAHAQALEYPAFQLPRVTETREYNFGVGLGSDSRSFVFQWREGYGPGSQLSFDGGFGDIDDGDPALLVGGQYAQQLVTADASIPVDLALTVGANLALFTGDAPDGVLVRVPLGVSLGRTLVVDAPTGFAITPYVHPRLSLDYFSAADDDKTDLALNVDIGGNFRFTPSVSGRLAFTLGGGDDDFLRGDSFGISLALTPRAINRR